MSLPLKQNVVLYQGDDYRKEFLFSDLFDEGEDPVDFSDHSMLAFVKSHPSSPQVIAVFDIDFPEASGEGESQSIGPVAFSASLSGEQTDRFPKTCVYDIQSINEVTGESRTWVYGQIRAIRQVTN